MSLDGVFHFCLHLLQFDLHLHFVHSGDHLELFEVFKFRQAIHTFDILDDSF